MSCTFREVGCVAVLTVLSCLKIYLGAFLKDRSLGHQQSWDLTLVEERM